MFTLQERSRLKSISYGKKRSEILVRLLPMTLQGCVRKINFASEA